ncbi:MAG: hypothetical protein MUF69_12860, partial [Desulfobacterota bacterium]|nr:hypothetical protein [Thermodesulfobacteriota bacterium]
MTIQRWIASFFWGALVLGVISSGAEPQVPPKLSESREAFRLEQKVGEGAGAVKMQPVISAPLQSGLVVRNITFSKMKPAAGETVEVRIVIQNVGAGDLPPIRLQHYLGRMPLGEQTFRGLKAKALDEVRFTFIPKQAGISIFKTVAAAEGRSADTASLEKTLEVLPGAMVRSALKTEPLTVRKLEGGLPGPGAPSQTISLRADLIIPNLTGQVENIHKQGQDTVIKVRVSNQGTGVAPPFSIGIFIAGPTGIPEGAPLVKTRIAEPLPPGAFKSLPLVMPSSAVFLADQKFVFKVDIENEVLEGPSGEKDNSSTPFTLTPGMALLSPLVFSQFKVLNPGLLPGETPKIFAQVLGGPVVAWQVSYHYAGGAVFIADYHKAPAPPSVPGPDQKPPFPALQGYGDYIEVPYSVWPPGTSAPVGEKAMVCLSVADAAGQIAKADTQVALLPGDFFEGTLQIDQVAYQLSGGKIVGVN